MSPKEKAKKGLLLLQEAIVDIVKENKGISTTEIIRRLSIETENKNGKGKGNFGASLIKCFEGTTGSLILGKTLQEVNNSKLESSKHRGRRCWEVQ